MWVIVVCMVKDDCLFLAHIAVGCMMLSAVEAPILEKMHCKCTCTQVQKAILRRAIGSHVAFPLGLYLSSSI